MFASNMSSNTFLQIPDDERTAVVSYGVTLRLVQLRDRLFLMQSKIKALEYKYGTTLAALDQSGLPVDANYELHEDFILWHHWMESVTETQQKIEALERVTATLTTGR